MVGVLDCGEEVIFAVEGEAFEVRCFVVLGLCVVDFAVVGGIA